MRVADCDSWVTHTLTCTRAHSLMPSQAYLGVTLVTSAPQAFGPIVAQSGIPLPGGCFMPLIIAFSS